MRGTVLAVVALSAISQPALAADQNVFGFAGRFTDRFIEHALFPFTASYENNYILGAGYQMFFLGDDGGLKLGAEVGAALRIGSPNISGEVWAGPVLRYDGLIVTENVKFSAAVTGGISYATDPIGIEAQREIENNGDSSLLFYMAPELSVSFAEHPNTEYFLRLQHRSGGWKTLGNFQDSANAVSLGIRQSF